MPKLLQSSLSGFHDISFNDEQRQKIEAASKLSFTSEQWEEVKDFCSEFVIWSLHRMEYPDAKEVTELLDGVNKHSKTLLGHIEAINQVNPSQAQQAARGLINTQLVISENLSSFISPLNDLAIASKQAMRTAEKMSEATKSGPAQKLEYGLLFKPAMNLFETSGGKPTSNWKAYEGERGGPFIDFLFELLKCMPNKFHPHSKGALGQRFRRYIEYLKEHRDKSPE